MARISMVEYDQTNAEQRAEYDGQIAAHGRITNMKKTLLHSVPAFKVLMEWYPLRDLVAEFAGEMGVNCLSFAISEQNDCLICSTFFRKILRDCGRDPDKLQLSKEEQLLMDFGKAIVADQHNVPEAVFTRLKAVYNEEQIVLLTAFAGMMIATNLINSVLDVDLDDYLTTYTRR